MLAGLFCIANRISIFDLECLNAFLRRQHLIGRCPNFATTASKLCIKEHRCAFLLGIIFEGPPGSVEVGRRGKSVAENGVVGEEVVRG